MVNVKRNLLRLRVSVCLLVNDPQSEKTSSTKVAVGTRRGQVLICPSSSHLSTRLRMSSGTLNRISRNSNSKLTSLDGCSSRAFCRAHAGRIRDCRAISLETAQHTLGDLHIRVVSNPSACYMRPSMGRDAQ